jgi:membrane peptidoglycan carboxypeptidase
LGELSNDLDILESCPTERDAPATDFIALKGPYRHHFEDDLSRSRMRVLARGAPGFVRLAEVPDLGRAFVTLEDARFWEHEGFDAAQIERAVWHNLSAGRFERGASTITQQTARNLWLGLDRSLGRKLQEAFLADRLERVLSKERILEIYLNVIQLGPGIYGVEEAARYYFGKPAAQLSLLQCVHIASLAPAPNRYAERFASGEVDSAWLAELHNQLRRMFIHGWITRSRLNEALRSDLALRATAAAESSRR